MSEVSRNLDECDFDQKELQVCVEFGGFKGVARMKRVGNEALKWHISIHAVDGRQISYWDGPDIQGDGPVLYTLQDVENAQKEINRAIEQYSWDPMSQA